MMRTSVVGIGENVEERALRISRRRLLLKRQFKLGAAVETPRAFAEWAPLGPVERTLRRRGNGHERAPVFRETKKRVDGELVASSRLANRSGLVRLVEHFRVATRFVRTGPNLPFPAEKSRISCARSDRRRSGDPTAPSENVPLDGKLSLGPKNG
jgi:hypothetical protein